MRPPGQTLTPLMWSRQKYAVSMIKKYAPKTDSCLEIGCGTGNFLNVLQKMGFSKITGIDISSTNLKIAANIAPLAELKAVSLFNLKDKYDAAIAFEVIEHIEHDEAALSYIQNNLLGENGILILSVPSHNSPFDLNFGHFRHYGRKELKTKLEKAGFNIIHFYSCGTKLVDSLGIRLLKPRYSRDDPSKEKATDESARIEFPPIWNKLLYPLLKPVYFIFHLVDWLIKDTDRGVDYLVLCRKGRL